MVAKKSNDHKRENMQLREIKSKLDAQIKKEHDCQEMVNSLKRKKSRLEDQIKELHQNIEERSKG